MVYDYKQFLIISRRSSIVILPLLTKIAGNFGLGLFDGDTSHDQLAVIHEIYEEADG